MATMRKAAGLIAAMLIAFGGGAMLQAGVPLFGGLLLGVGVGAAIWQARVLYLTREDPYDLRRLFDPPPTEDVPEEDFCDDEFPFCHNCGHAVARPFARCPECGSPVR